MVALVPILVVALRFQREDPAMYDIEMALDGPDSQPITNRNNKPCKNALTPCPPSEKGETAFIAPMDVDEKNLAPAGSCGLIVSLPFPGELLANGSFAVEYHDMYVLFTLLFYGLYSHEHFSDQTKIRRQQLVDLCARYKLTRSGNMNTLRASLRSFSSNRELWERCVSIPLTQSQTAHPVF